MPTNRRRRTDEEVIPFKDPEFRRRAVYFDDIEYQRKFEQNLIRYNLPNEVRVTEIVNSGVDAGGGGGGGGVSCYWVKIGAHIYYKPGHVAIDMAPNDTNNLAVAGNVLIEGVSEAPYLHLQNKSDTAYDPLIKWSLGAVPILKFIAGVDDSDSDKWKISNLSALGTLAVAQGAFSDRLVFFHEADENLCYVDLADFTTDGVIFNGTAGSGDGQFSAPKSITYDGAYLYVSDFTNNRVQKFDAAGGTFVAKVSIRRPWGICHWEGYVYVVTNSSLSSKYQIYKINADTMAIEATYEFDYGTGNDQFNGPRGMATDGTNLYICDTANSRIKKCTMVGAYVAKVGSSGSGNGQFGGSSPVDCEVDGTYLYVCDYGNRRIQVFDIAAMTYQAQHATQTVGGAAGSPGSIAINDLYYYVNCDNAAPNNGYIEKYDIATRSFQASYNTIVISVPEDSPWSAEVAKFASSLTKYGDLWVLHQDGSYLDTWPICRFMDDVRLVEGDDEDGDYVGLRAPAAVTASYALTFPAALPAGQSHLSCSSAGTLSFGQDVNTTASPSFVKLTLTQAIGTAPMTITSTTVVTNLNADLLDGYHETAFVRLTAVLGDMIYGNVTPIWAKLTGNIAATKKYLSQTGTGAVSAAPVWDEILGIGALTDPGADRILFWDESSGASGALTWLSPGNSIAITTTTVDTIQDLRTTDSPTFATPIVTGITIGANTLTTLEWAYLDGQDQAVKTTSSPSFDSIALPYTRSPGLTGIITKGGVRFLHDFNNALADGINLFIGEEAGNFIVGPAAGDPTGWGSGNLGVGYFALRDVTKGYYNTCVGQWSGQDIITGGRNSFFGADSGYKTTTGSNNTFLGHMAGFENLTGVENVFVGADAGLHGTTVLQTVLVGFEAGHNITTLDARGDVIIGYRAGLGITTMGMSVVIGYMAGYYLTTGGAWGAMNTLVGPKSGFDPTADAANNRITTDTKMICVGWGASKNNAGALDNCIAIGNKCWVTKSHQTKIGNDDTLECYLRGGLLLDLARVPTAANNAAAAVAGILVGGFYRTNADPSVLCIRSA